MVFHVFAQCLIDARLPTRPASLEKLRDLSRQANSRRGLAWFFLWSALTSGATQLGQRVSNAPAMRDDGAIPRFVVSCFTVRGSIDDGLPSDLIGQ